MKEIRKIITQDLREGRQTVTCGQQPISDIKSHILNIVPQKRGTFTQCKYIYIYIYIYIICQQIT